MSANHREKNPVTLILITAGSSNRVGEDPTDNALLYAILEKFSTDENVSILGVDTVRGANEYVEGLADTQRQNVFAIVIGHPIHNRKPFRPFAVGFSCSAKLIGSYLGDQTLIAQGLIVSARALQKSPDRFLRQIPEALAAWFKKREENATGTSWSWSDKVGSAPVFPWGQSSDEQARHEKRRKKRQLLLDAGGISQGDCVNATGYRLLRSRRRRQTIGFVIA